MQVKNQRMFGKLEDVYNLLCDAFWMNFIGGLSIAIRPLKNGIKS